jgi:hypothetical protein
LLLLASLPVGFDRIDRHSARDSNAVPSLGIASAGGSASLTASYPPRRALWEASHEAGNLLEWWAPEPFQREGANGGGEYNSGIADADVASDVAHSGSWSAKLTIDTSTQSGSRLFRWLEPRVHRELYYEAWFYFLSCTDLPRIQQLAGIGTSFNSRAAMRV